MWEGRYACRTTVADISVEEGVIRMTPVDRSKFRRSLNCCSNIEKEA